MNERSAAKQTSVFDDAVPASARPPAGLDLSARHIFFFWQPPNSHMLIRLRGREPRAPILIGRHVAETPVRAAGPAYWCPAGFFSLRALVDMELTGVRARQQWSGDPPPDYLGMPLVDGDLPRLRFWNEVLPAATLVWLARVVRSWKFLRIGSVGDRLGRQGCGCGGSSGWTSPILTACHSDGCAIARQRFRITGGRLFVMIGVWQVRMRMSFSRWGDGSRSGCFTDFRSKSSHKPGIDANCGCIDTTRRCTH